MSSGYMYAAQGAFQIMSGLQQAEMMRESGKLAREIAEMNARFAEIDAYEAEKFSLTESARYQSKVDQTVSDQRTGMAAQNIDITSGTAAAIQEETKLTGFLNTLDIEAQGRARAMGLRRQAGNIRMGGSQSNAQADLNAGATVRGSLISGLQSGISAYERF